MRASAVTGLLALCWAMAGVAQAAGPAPAPGGSSESPAPGRKPGNVAGICITYREGTHVVETFPDGTRLLATVKGGVLVGYSAVDRRGAPLAVTASREPPEVPGSARAGELERARRRRLVEEARARGDVVGPGCWVVIRDPSRRGGPLEQYRTCPGAGPPGAKGGNVAGGCISFQSGRNGGDAAGTCVPMTAGQKPGTAAGTCIPMAAGQKAGSVAGSCIPMAAGQKAGSVAGGCIPMGAGQKRGDVTGDCDPMIRGQKRGDVTGDCDPMTRGSARGHVRDGSHVVDTFPGGARLLAAVKGGELVGYSAVDGRGKALKVRVSRDPAREIMPAYAAERGQQRAREAREAMDRALRDARARGRVEGSGCYVFVIGGSGDLAGVSYGGCPRGT